MCTGFALVALLSAVVLAGVAGRESGRAASETSGARISADGSSTASREIVYVTSNGNLAVMNADGFGRRQLTTSGSSSDGGPAWSPDRRRVAFGSNRPTADILTSDVFVVDADGTGLRTLVATKASEGSPSWSPDGRWIVFAKDRTGRGHTDLYVVRVSTGKVSRLTPTNAREENEAVPAWSPDGRWIAYERHGEIWVMRSDGSRPRALGKVAAYSVEWAPDWSPDSRLIAFESNGRTSSVNPSSEIWVMRADGTGKKRLTHNSILDTSPAWSPDGRRIAFVRDFRIWTMRPDGSSLRRLSSGQEPDW
jgi:Tol biopolymer transport system component